MGWSIGVSPAYFYISEHDLNFDLLKLCKLQDRRCVEIYCGGCEHENVETLDKFLGSFKITDSA